MPVPLTVTEANCGTVQEPSRRGPPVNWASGGLVGRVTAVPILWTIDTDNPTAVVDCLAVNGEDNLEDLDPEADLVVVAQAVKSGMEILTPAQSCELNEIASKKQSAPEDSPLQRI
jgi:hypothetical protein